MSNSKNRVILQPADLTVVAAEPSCLERAKELAERLGATCATEPPSLEEAPIHLRVDARGVTLSGGEMELRGDFSRLLPRLKPGKLQQELLVKAARIKGAGTWDVPPLAVDATAGLGEDALLLAAAGFRVIMFEYDPVIGALLEDALRRATVDPALADIAARMELRLESSVDALPHLDEQPDVVLLDPMFPERTKSASVKKKFQLLHHLEQPCGDEEALLDAAIAAQPRKIVVKRPPKGPFLAGMKPAYQISGKAVRYDCLAFARS
ncbi:MAG: class I SAM-dependent methyltransferase [Coriobacteriia bacterium]|nr:class I SAM-dependent methyltransferase [Coriobacteriia bacterium]